MKKKTLALRFGAHTLSSMFWIKSEASLRRMMQTAAKHGCTMIEMPYGLCTLPWDVVARIARECSIKEISLCHFWPFNEGKSVCGNPLGTGADYEKCFDTLREILAAVETLREGGITVRFIDGPTHCGLGWSHGRIPRKEKHRRVVKFLKAAGKLCKKHDIILAVEFLRPGEDYVVGSTKAMVKILKRVNLPNVGMHLDVYHCLRRNENPAASIRYAGKWIVYLHLHGTDRRAPGSKGDQCKWGSITIAIEKIRSGVKLVPAVSEPFGRQTCLENAALGKGLPIPPPLGRYLAQTVKTFRRVVMPIPSLEE